MSFGAWVNLPVLVVFFFPALPYDRYDFQIGELLRFTVRSVWEFFCNISVSHGVTFFPDRVTEYRRPLCALLWPTLSRVKIDLMMTSNASSSRWETTLLSMADVHTVGTQVVVAIVAPLAEGKPQFRSQASSHVKADCSRSGGQDDSTG